MTLPSWHYGDPARVAERRERHDCTGCKHMSRLWGAAFCEKDKWSGIDNMKRCEQYQYERGSHGNG